MLKKKTDVADTRNLYQLHALSLLDSCFSIFLETKRQSYVKSETISFNGLNGFASKKNCRKNVNYFLV